MGTLVPSTFRPAWWLTNRHLQTLWPTLTRRIQPPPRHSEILPTPDGDFLKLDWCGGNSGPLVLILHGLAGCSRSHYVLGLQWALLNLGWRSVALNFRGCGWLNRTARCYHSGETEDLDWVYHHLRRREPSTPLAAVGYSLGGNVLLKWLGEKAETVDLFAACAVSVPLVLARCAEVMDRGLARFYRNRLLHELKTYLNAKIRHLEHIGMDEEAQKLKNLGDLHPIRSFWEYDDRVIAKLYPFQDVHDYYQRCSSRQYLQFIEVPTLLIQSRDDPFMSPDMIPTPEETAPAVYLEITCGGGHVGFITGSRPGREDYWLERRIPEFLASQLQKS